MRDTENATIGLVVPSLDGGGGVPSVARFVKDVALTAGRFDLRVVSLSVSSTDPASTRIAAPSTWWRGVNSVDGTWEGLPYAHIGAVAGDLEFQRYRSREVLMAALADCDLIQVVAGSPAWANAVVGLGKPVSLQVATRARVERRCRDAKPRSLAGWWRKAMTEVTDRFDDGALRMVDAIQVENPWMLEYARSLNVGREVDIRYAPPGVDAETFRPAVKRCIDGGYVLCVGRLDDPRKNIGLLLDAYALLPEALLGGFELVLAGASGPVQKFWKRVGELGLRDRVRFVERPTSDELVALYQGASLFVLPSDEEGLGIVVLEAMACGVPAVCTSCGGPDGIITDGKDGFLVPLADAAALANQMQCLLSDPALNASMGMAARRTIESRYAKQVAGAAFLDIWDRLLEAENER